MVLHKCLASVKRRQTQFYLERMQVAKARHLCRIIGPLFPRIEITYDIQNNLAAKDIKRVPKHDQERVFQG